MVYLEELEEPEKDEKRVIIYFLGISLSYIALVGGLLVFILLLLDVNTKIFGGLFSAYLSLALAISMTFLHKPLQRVGLRKFFGAGSAIFLIIAIVLLLGYFGV